jgi:hypothetical protein
MDFSSLFLRLSIRVPWLPRRILLTAGRRGIMFRVSIKGYIDLNNSSPPQSPSLSPPPSTSVSSKDTAPSTPTNNLHPDINFPPCARHADAHLLFLHRHQTSPWHPRIIFALTPLAPPLNPHLRCISLPEVTPVPLKSAMF